MSNSFTLIAAPHSLSRIDRTYAVRKLVDTAREWRIKTNPLENTDHDIATVVIVNEAAPTMGSGRRSFPSNLIKNKIMMKHLREKGMEALERVKSIGAERSEAQNPQTIWNEWKISVMKEVMRLEKTDKPKLDQMIDKVRTRLNKASLHHNIPGTSQIIQISKLKQELKALECRKLQMLRQYRTTKSRLESETMSKWWFKSSKEQKLRDIIYVLRKLARSNSCEDKDMYEKDSTKMAQLRRD